MVDAFVKFVFNDLCYLDVLGPAVLLADLRLLLGREIVLDVKLLADLLHLLALDHGRHLRRGANPHGGEMHQCVKMLAGARRLRIAA